MKNDKLKIAIVGSSGYTGGELYRILLHHPGAVVTAVTSEKSAGKPITDIFPHLLGLTDLVCEPLDPASIAKKADLAFLALPHVTAQEAAFQLHKQGVKVVDLSADYRLADPALSTSRASRSSTSRLIAGWQTLRCTRLGTSTATSIPTS
jgi:N-acetyl-gamma-glutamyl-phosphate reductase